MHRKRFIVLSCSFTSGKAIVNLQQINARLKLLQSPPDKIYIFLYHGLQGPTGRSVTLPLFHARQPLHITLEAVLLRLKIKSNGCLSNRALKESFGYKQHKIFKVRKYNHKTLRKIALSNVSLTDVSTFLTFRDTGCPSGIMSMACSVF